MDKQLETRAASTFAYDGAARKVSGYGVVFYDGTEGTQFRLSPNTVERIHPNAFDESLKNNNVILRRMHDRRQPLARTPETMRLAKDAKGITYEGTIIDSTTGRDAVAELQANILRGASVGFVEQTAERRFTKEGNLRVITIMRADMEEISLVDESAYPATTASVRWADEQDNGITIEQMEEIVAKHLDKSRPKLS